MALLLALATLREPVAAPSMETAAWSDSALHSQAGNHGDAGAVAPAASSRPELVDGTTMLQPVAISDHLTIDVDGSAVFDEARAGAIALEMASRLAWQVTGSFTLAPFGGVWVESWPGASAVDSGIAVIQ